MAKRIAKFEKVSFEQFKGGYTDAIGEASDEQIREVYDRERRRRFQPESVRRWKITGCFSAIQEAVWDSNSACS